MRCLDCGWIYANVVGRYCPNCGSDKFRNDLDAKNAIPSRFDLEAPTTY